MYRIYIAQWVKYPLLIRITDTDTTTNSTSIRTSSTITNKFIIINYYTTTKRGSRDTYPTTKISNERQMRLLHMAAQRSSSTGHIPQMLTNA